MAVKSFSLPDIGEIKVYKRKGSRSIRLSITGSGSVRVTQPYWLPYRSGLEFARSRREWIVENFQPQSSYYDGQLIGKSYVLCVVPDAPKLRTRLTATKLLVYLPKNLQLADPLVQNRVKQAAERALLKDAKKLLVPRTQTLADEHGFKLASVDVKHLRSRWGSCSQKQDILLSSYLVQLPWHYIDYVILHELVHTKIMAHGKPFWNELANYVDNLNETREYMKQYKATLQVD